MAYAKFQHPPVIPAKGTATSLAGLLKYPEASRPLNERHPALGGAFSRNRADRMPRLGDPPGFFVEVMALASVELDIDGIVMTIHGVPVIKAKASYGDCLQVRLPAHRTPDGQWQPSMELPQELELPLGRAILDACRERAQILSC